LTYDHRKLLSHRKIILGFFVISPDIFAGLFFAVMHVGGVWHSFVTTLRILLLDVVRGLTNGECDHCSKFVKLKLTRSEWNFLSFQRSFEVADRGAVS